MAEYTTLEPVVLANDDFCDEDQTFKKQTFSQISEFECAQRYTTVQHTAVSPSNEFAYLSPTTSDETAVKQIYTQSTCTIDCAQRPTMNVSSRHLVQVTPDNVESIYNELDQPPIGQRDYSADLIQLCRDLPKDMFVTRLLDDNNSDEVRLKDVRYNLFSQLKSLEEFPFSLGTELKRRKHTRVGESVAMKLCYDIYVLTSVLDGAPFEDMKDLISSGKSNPLNDSVCGEQNSPNPSAASLSDNNGNNNVEVTLLQNLVANMQADILAIKQDNNGIREEIKSLKQDMKLIRGDFTQNFEKVNSSIYEIWQSVERVTDMSNNGISCTKNDIKQIRTDMFSVNESIQTQYEQLKETLSLVQKIEKRANKLEDKINKCQKRNVSSESCQTTCEPCIYTISDSDNEQQTYKQTPNRHFSVTADLRICTV